MKKAIKNVLTLTGFLFLLIVNNPVALAECALVLTSPADGAVFTSSASVTIGGYAKASVDPGAADIEVFNNGDRVFFINGQFSDTDQLFKSGTLTFALAEGANHIEVKGSASGCNAYDTITVYYYPDAEAGPDADIGFSPQKGDGPSKCQNYGGDPINIATGNVTVHTVDFQSGVSGLPTRLHLKFERYYNNRTAYNSPLGYGWTHNYNVSVIPADAGGIVGVRRESGQVLYFKDAGGGAFTAPEGAHNKLLRVNNQYLFTTTENITYTFDEQGRLLSIADQHGNMLTMSYDIDDTDKLVEVSDAFSRSIRFEYSYVEGLITKMTDSGGGEYLYEYDSVWRNLIEVTYPSDGEAEKIEYEYDDPADDHNLTGVIDENGHIYTYDYDADDRAILSTAQGGVNRIDIDYSGGDTVEVTNARGYKMIYTRELKDGIGYITQIAAATQNGGGCQSCGAAGHYEYDADHNLSSVTDARGIITRYTYDNRGNMLTVTEASGSGLERLTAYTPHAVFDKPEYITVKSADTPSQNKITEIGYDLDTGDALFISVKGYAGGQYGIRTITLEEYTPHGQIQRINGSRTDVNDITAFEYHADTDVNIFNRGMLYRIVNALGQTTEFDDYNHFGLPQMIKDVNNVETLFNYDARGRLTGKTLSGKTTAYAYDKAGNLKTVTPPGLKGSVSFDYTPADLIEYVHDQPGNHLKFGYDNESNLISEENYDSGSVMKRNAHYEYNTFNRLWKTVNPDGTFALINTDANGNVTGHTDAVNRATQFAFDDLNRLMTRVQPGDVTTTYQHDVHDNPAEVTDAENTVTNYTYDDFGGLRTLSSPDTGDVTYDYDAAGNLKSKIDANQVTANYIYDKLNRLIYKDFPTNNQDIGFIYDEAAAVYGKGRLTMVNDSAGVTSYQYDARGFITQETRVADNITYNTQYAYNDRGNPATLTYPTGSQVEYLRHDNERVSGILIDGHVLTQNVTYMPFGPEEDFVFGENILTIDREYYDNYYRLQSIDAQVLNFHYQYYADGNVKTIDGLPVPGVSDGQTEYQKSAAGNRLNRITEPDNTVYDYVYDNNGNTISDGVFTYEYNRNNRLIKVKHGAAVIAQYLYDAFGRRVKKTISGTVTHFHYSSAGSLISETAGDGSPLRDYIYQNGNLIAIKLYGVQAGIYYVVCDHLGTPQQIVNSSGVVVWKAAYQPFGKAQILIETITCNIRFKGQYSDAETGLHYNVKRYYNPLTGMYLTPDPIGLEGGINLYPYVKNNPINYIDPTGEFIFVGTAIAVGGAYTATMALADITIAYIVGQIASNVYNEMSGHGIYGNLPDPSILGDSIISSPCPEDPDEKKKKEEKKKKRNKDKEKKKYYDKNKNDIDTQIDKEQSIEQQHMPWQEVDKTKQTIKNLLNKF